MDVPIELASQEGETTRRSQSPGYGAYQGDFFDEKVTPQQVKPVLGSKNRRKMLNPSELPVMLNPSSADNQTPAFHSGPSNDGHAENREPSVEAVRINKGPSNGQNLK